MTGANTPPRTTPLTMSPAEFRTAAHRLVDLVADRLARIPDGPVSPNDTPTAIRRVLGAERGLPNAGTDASELVTTAAEMLFDHSLFNAHPRFFGYITSSPSPIGMLGDFLAAALNQNVGAWNLSPLATEVELQTVRWLAELIGLPPGGGGLLVSGGNMANFIGFLAARAAAAGWDVRTDGVGKGTLAVYASAETHTWVQKAADMFGLGTAAIRWIPTTAGQRMDVAALRRRVEEDVRLGHRPFLAVGTAGTVSTGAVDPLAGIAAVCREHGMWFHVDGAYGAVAAQAEGAPADLAGLAEADSIAVDPHKWLYAPLEAGCVLVRDPEALQRTFAYHPPYYVFDERVVNFFEHGPQNSRGFRALKVWLALQHAGREGYLRMIGDDMRIAGHLFACLEAHPQFQALTHGLSVTTFRFVPADLRSRLDNEDVEKHLEQLNRELQAAVEHSGEAFLSNAVVDGRFALRACIVNFHTSPGDVEALVPLVVRLGTRIDARLRDETGVGPQTLAADAPAHFERSR
jgi:glutamate/tyrosine decarboxylase-like PLP-dependent enzyme